MSENDHSRVQSSMSLLGRGGRQYKNDKRWEGLGWIYNLTFEGTHDGWMGEMSDDCSVRILVGRVAGFVKTYDCPWEILASLDDIITYMAQTPDT